MRTVTAALLLSVLVAPALAQTYPVQGRWGQSTNSEKGAIDCVGKRVIEFVGNQRTQRRRAQLPQSLGHRGRSVELSHCRRIHHGTDQCRPHVLHFAESGSRPYRTGHGRRRLEAAAVQRLVSGDDLAFATMDWRRFGNPAKPSPKKNRRPACLQCAPTATSRAWPFYVQLPEMRHRD